MLKQHFRSKVLPNKKVSFTPHSLIISGENGIITVDENNFEFLQEAITQIFCLNGKGGENTFNPANDKAKEIAEKIMKGRQKVAAEKGENKGSVFITYISVLSIGLHIPITELLKYTIFMLYDSLQRFGLWIEYDLDIRSRLAGATPHSQVENWMKNMY